MLIVDTVSSSSSGVLRAGVTEQCPVRDSKGHADVQTSGI